jgi:hypothetical protein
MIEYDSLRVFLNVTAVVPACPCARAAASLRAASAIAHTHDLNNTRCTVMLCYGAPSTARQLCRSQLGVVASCDICQW